MRKIIEILQFIWIYTRNSFELWNNIEIYHCLYELFYISRFY
jgi:hypothetical protein